MPRLIPHGVKGLPWRPVGRIPTRRASEELREADRGSQSLADVSGQCGQERAAVPRRQFAAAMFFENSMSH